MQITTKLIHRVTFTSVLLFTVCLLEPLTVTAQWTLPDTSQNISNTNTGNVGIGTSNPTAKLEVNKNQNAGTAINLDNGHTGASNSAFSGIWFKQGGANRFVIASNNDNNSTQNGGPGGVMFWNFANGPTLFATNNTEQMRITPTGFVGIGTNAPDVKLQVHHSSANTNLGNLQLENLALGLRNTSNTNGAVTIISFQDASGYGNVNIGAVQKDQTNHAADLVFLTRNGFTAFGERMRVRSDGKVGIGTNAPSAQLHIMTASGDGDGLRIHRNGNSTGWGVAQYFVLNNSSGTATDYAQISGGISSNTAGAESGVMAFYTRNAGSLAERMRIIPDGRVGIGTPTPGFKLDVQGGSINATDGLCINGVCKGSWSQVASQWSDGSGSINYGGGSVGIGISSPVYKLDVNGGTNNFRAKAATTSANDAIATFENNTAIQMIVRGNGNVGLGITGPTEKLEVNGNLKVSGTGNITATGTIEGANVKAKYQDVAEWVESSQDLAAGTVVVLDSDKSNQVIASTQAYDSRVAGVISLRPGIVLGEEGEGRVLVATTGRVKVKVDAANGPIKIGDLLVTSDKEGFAMKSIPVEFGGVRMHRPGTLIGKALEPMAHGTGEILVLLSMQ
jgi:Peptidase_G2, IMC autoproteolytic cleavage domain